MGSKTDACRKYLETMPEKFTANELAAFADASPALVNSVLNKEVAKGTLKKSKKGRSVAYTKIGEFKANPHKVDIPVNERFGYIFEFAQMVGSGQIPSLLLTGQAGVGKTYTIIEALTGLCLEEGVDYKVVKGHSSPMGLYQLLFENSEGLIVLDDCDSAWSDQSSLNILKAALDSYSRRTISWVGLAAERAGLPDCFEFKGSIIFISNKDARKLDPAVVSRTITANLVMTNGEIIDRMEGIAPSIEQDVSMDKKAEVIGFLREHQEKFQGLSLRTFIQACRLRKSSKNWKNMTLYTLTS